MLSGQWDTPKSDMSHFAANSAFAFPGGLTHDSPLFLPVLAVEPSPTTGIQHCIPPLFHGSYAKAATTHVATRAVASASAASSPPGKQEAPPSAQLRQDMRSAKDMQTSSARKVAAQNVAPVPATEPGQPWGAGQQLAVYPTLPSVNVPEVYTTASAVQSGGRNSGKQSVANHDGWQWRKYGEKLVKNSVNPRSYYKCSHPNCGAKKIVERDCNGDIINTEYKGDHTHPAPSVIKPMRVAKAKGGSKGANQMSQLAWNEERPSRFRRQQVVADDYSYEEGEDEGGGEDDASQHHVGGGVAEGYATAGHVVESAVGRDPSVSQDGSTDAIAYAAATGMPLDFSAIASLGYSIPGSARVSGNGGPTPQLGHAGMGGVGAFTLNDVLAMYDGDALAGVKKLRSADQSCAGDSPSKRLDALAAYAATHIGEEDPVQVKRESTTQDEATHSKAHDLLSGLFSGNEASNPPVTTPTKSAPVVTTADALLHRMCALPFDPAKSNTHVFDMGHNVVLPAPAGVAGGAQIVAALEDGTLGHGGGAAGGVGDAHDTSHALDQAGASIAAALEAYRPPSAGAVAPGTWLTPRRGAASTGGMSSADGIVHIVPSGMGAVKHRHESGSKRQRTDVAAYHDQDDRISGEASGDTRSLSMPPSSNTSVSQGHHFGTHPKVVESAVTEDGYRWRKYGQKQVKGSPYPRHYFKCTYPECNVRKHVEQSQYNEGMYVITYEGQHIHPAPGGYAPGPGPIQGGRYGAQQGSHGAAMSYDDDDSGVMESPQRKRSSQGGRGSRSQAGAVGPGGVPHYAYSPSGRAPRINSHGSASSLFIQQQQQQLQQQQFQLQQFQQFHQLQQAAGLQQQQPGLLDTRSGNGGNTNDAVMQLAGLQPSVLLHSNGAGENGAAASAAAAEPDAAAAATASSQLPSIPPLSVPPQSAPYGSGLPGLLGGIDLAAILRHPGEVVIPGIGSWDPTSCLSLTPKTLTGLAGLPSTFDLAAAGLTRISTAGAAPGTTQQAGQ